MGFSGSLYTTGILPAFLSTPSVKFLFLPGRAISFVTKNFFSKANGNRGSAPNVAVVIVDGWPTDKVEEASRFARESGINIFFITVEGATENEKQYVVEPNFSHKVRNCPRDPPTVRICCTLQSCNCHQGCSPTFEEGLSSLLGRGASSEGLVSLEPRLTLSEQDPTPTW